MNDLSRMSRPEMSQDTLSATGSPESESGAIVCAGQDGRTVDPSGPAVALANLSARQAKELGLLTSGTFGQAGSGSLASASLSACLVSRLRLLSQWLGSTLYGLTWKEKTTPSRRQICALRASVRRSSGKDCSGWPAPNLGDYNNSRLPPEKCQEYSMKPLHRVNACSQLADVAQALTGWNSPQARDHFPAHSEEYVAAKKAQGHGMQNLNDTVQLAGWANPNCPRNHDSDNTAGKVYASKMQRDLPEDAWLTDWQPSGEIPGYFKNQTLLADWPSPMAGTPAQNGYNEAGNTDSSRRTVELAGWPSPTASMITEADLVQALTAGNSPNRKSYNESRNMFNLLGPARLTASGDLLTGSDAGMTSGGQLNPEHSRWLMALPPEWQQMVPWKRSRAKRR